MPFKPAQVFLVSQEKMTNSLKIAFLPRLICRVNVRDIEIQTSRIGQCLDNGVLGLGRLDVEEGTARHGRYYGHWHALLNYRAATDVQWTVVSPPPGTALHPGERTGVFRLGEDEVIVGENGEASISEEDLAMAYINEVENPQSIGRRITIGY